MDTQSMLNTLIRMGATLVCTTRPAQGLQCNMEVYGGQVDIWGCDHDQTNGITCSIKDISVDFQKGILTAKGIDDYGDSIENDYNIYIPITHVSNLII